MRWAAKYMCVCLFIFFLRKVEGERDSALFLCVYFLKKKYNNICENNIGTFFKKKYFFFKKSIDKVKILSYNVVIKSRKGMKCQKNSSKQDNYKENMKGEQYGGF